VPSAPDLAPVVPGRRGQGQAPDPGSLATIVARNWLDERLIYLLGHRLDGPFRTGGWRLDCRWERYVRWLSFLTFLR